MTDHPDLRPIGQINFEAYDTKRGGLTHDGKPTPHWPELGDGVREGWTAGADATVRSATEQGQLRIARILKVTTTSEDVQATSIAKALVDQRYSSEHLGADQQQAVEHLATYVAQAMHRQLLPSGTVYTVAYSLSEVRAGGRIGVFFEQTGQVFEVTAP